jgi:hypothetical protein
MLHDIIARAIAAEPDMTLEAEFGPSAPDVVIVGGGGEELADATRLLSRWPHSAVIAIEVNGGHANVYELLPRLTDLGEVSTNDLVRLIRAKASNTVGWS